MYRKYLLHRRILYCAYIPGLTNSLDDPKPVKLIPQNGLERVMTLLEKDEYGELNKNLVSSQQISFGSAFLVGCYAGLRSAKLAFENFVDANQLTRFRSPFEAKRLMADHVAVEFGKQFLIYGLKGYIFTALLMTTITAVSLYRDKEGILEYTLGGIVAGSLMRINYGLKGMCAGAFAASGVSTLAGIVLFAISKLKNYSIQDLRDYQYSLKKWRKEKLKEAIEHSDDGPISAPLLHYTKKLTEMDANEDEKVYILRNSDEK